MSYSYWDVSEKKAPAAFSDEHLELPFMIEDNYYDKGIYMNCVTVKCNFNIYTKTIYCEAPELCLWGLPPKRVVKKEVIVKCLEEENESDHP